MKFSTLKFLFLDGHLTVVHVVQQRFYMVKFYILKHNTKLLIQFCFEITAILFPLLIFFTLFILSSDSHSVVDISVWRALLLL